MRRNRSEPAERKPPVKYLTRADALSKAIWWAEQGEKCAMAPAQMSCAAMSQAWSSVSALISPPYVNRGPG